MNSTLDALSIKHAHSALSRDILDIADTYQNSNGDVFPDFSSFERWIAHAYHRLPFRVEFVDHDPYPSLSAMRTHVDDSGVLKITTRNNESLFDPKVNLMFRAVHDSDHIQHHCGFDAYGEIRACRVISRRCPDEWSRALLFSEIVGQACSAIVHGTFDDQKFVNFPPRLRDRVLAEG